MILNLLYTCSAASTEVCNAFEEKTDRSKRGTFSFANYKLCTCLNSEVHAVLIHS